MSWFSNIFIPSFPPYPGPHSVGTCDFEIPHADLTHPLGPTPKILENVPTVAFRAFYPCEKPSQQSRPVRWVPNPQRPFLAAYAQFLGAGLALANVISSFSRLLHYVNIPATRNGKILKPDGPNGRWPVMVFCHGLGGSRNAYSWLLGSIASHGVVVIAPDHRDASGPVSYIRSPSSANPTQPILYRNLPHVRTEEVHSARDDQLRVRMWEMTAIFDALVKMDEGRADLIRNLDPNSPSGSADDYHHVIPMFSGMLDLKPGKVAWAGHSFGASTVVQLVKSVYWHQNDPTFATDETYKPLLVLDTSSSLFTQITVSSPTVLLDLWTLPLRSSSTRWIWNKPLPTYLNPDDSQVSRGALSIMSNKFVEYAEISKNTRRVLSRRPSDAEPSLGRFMGPHAYYVGKSAHLSQSDFGILFPHTTIMTMHTQDPERILKLNSRAICEFLRQCGIAVSDPTLEDFTVSSSQPPALSPVPKETILDKTGRVDLQDWIPFEIELATVRPESKDSVMSGKDKSVGATSPRI